MGNFQQKLLNEYPELKNNHRATSVDKKKLKIKFKKTFTENHIVAIVKESLKIDPDRKNRKFPFEFKLQPFDNKIDNFRHRDPKIQYNLKIP